MSPEDGQEVITFLAVFRAHLSLVLRDLISFVKHSASCREVNIASTHLHAVIPWLLVVLDREFGKVTGLLHLNLLLIIILMFVYLLLQLLLHFGYFNTHVLGL